MTDPVQPTLILRTFSTPRHTTHYIACGPADGPLMVFVHGWPSIGLMWRAQVEAFAAEGWRCIAPDLRGFGGSSAPAVADAYTIEEVVADIVELHDHVGDRPAIWVGHDWGCVVVGALVAHHPRRSRGVVFTSLAYQPEGHALRTLVPLIDRTLYDVDEHPDGQWDYYRYYKTNFAVAVADLNADKASSLASIFRSGRPAAVGEVSPLAMVTRNGGRFGAVHRAPPTQPDPALWPPTDFEALVRAFDTHGFRHPCAWYLNDDAAIAYAHEAPHAGHLSSPVLFINGDFDQVCTIVGNRQGEPMRAACPDLTVTSMPAGHWLPLERKAKHIEAVRNWLRSKDLR